MAARRAWTGPDPDEITAWTIVQAGHVVGRRFWAQLGEIGVNPVQFGVLLQLDLHPDMGNAELARAVLVTPQSMSELMASLEELGLVERTASGPGHRVTARLTPAGRRKLRSCSSVIDEVERSLGLSAPAMASLRKSLRKVVAPPPGEARH